MKKGVQGVVIYKGKVLLIKRSDIPVWTLPGGHIELNETPEEAVIREVKEETGLAVSIIEFIGSYTVKYWSPAGNTKVFLCKSIGGKLYHSTNESREIRFFPLNHLPLVLLPYIHSRIKDGIRIFKTKSDTTSISVK